MFKDRLKQARKSKGYTQESIAQKIGVKKSTFSGYESGNSEPDMEKLIKIMNILEIDANYLYQDEVSTSSGPNFSENATEIAYAFDKLTPAGKELIETAMMFASKYHAKRSHINDDEIPLPRIGTVHGVPLFQMPDDMRLPTKLAAKEEVKELNADVESVIKE